MSTYVKRIDAIGIHGRFDIHQEFKGGLNIIFGKNGAGKTTLLHILANALSNDFDRFKHIRFQTIDLILSNDQKISIASKKGLENSIEVRLDRKKIYPISNQSSDNAIKQSFINRVVESGRSIDELDPEILSEYIRVKKLSGYEPIIPTAYFPAFRTMIEAWMAAEIRNESEHKRRVSLTNEWKDLATQRARGWFGGFTPKVDFPSLIDIETQLSNQIEAARRTVWSADQVEISKAFSQILGTLSNNKKIDENLTDLLEAINELFNRLKMSPLRYESNIDYDKLREFITKLDIKKTNENTALNILTVYKKYLENSLKIQNISFEGIKNYLTSVNDFLDGKSLEFTQDVSSPRKLSIKIKFDDNSYSDGLRILSSGERQIMTLVYAATHMSKQQIVLIDEPEISLHVDWQRMLMKRMAEQMGDRQIIACTHSPLIASDHLEEMRELSLYPTKEKLPIKVEDIEEIPF